MFALRKLTAIILNINYGYCFLPYGGRAFYPKENQSHGCAWAVW